MTIRALALAVLVTLSLFTRTTVAQTFTFNNPAGGPWSTAANWTPSSGPVVAPNTATSIARFNSAAGYNVDVDGSYNVLAVQYGASQVGTINLRGVGGTAPRVINLNPGVGANGSIPANNGSTTIYLENGAGNQTIAGTLGVFLGNGPAASPVNHVWEIAGTSTLTVGAQITATSASANTLTKVGSGTLVLTNNNSGSPLWTGGLTINQGRVTVNGPTGGTGTGPVTVNSGGTLGGRGQINMGVTTLTTINASGVLTAGTSAGAPELRIFSAGSGGLTMNVNSTLAVNLFGTGPTEMSLVTVQGNTLINTNIITLDLGLVSSSQSQVDLLRASGARSYRVLTSTESLSGTGFNAAGFTVTNLGLFSSSEWSFGAFDTVGDGIVNGIVTVNFSPVPEPESLLAVASVLLIAVYQYRTKSVQLVTH